MIDEELRAEAQQRARVRATEDVHNRLALISTVVWAILVGALTVLFAWTFERPPRAPLILLTGFLLIVPAAIPWLWRGRWIEGRAQRYAREEYDQLARERR